MSISDWHPELRAGALVEAEKILDKRAYEESIVAALSKMLSNFERGRGPWAFNLVGSYPGTTLRVSGPSTKTHRHMDFDFDLWKYWSESLDVHGTALMLYSDMDS